LDAREYEEQNAEHALHVLRWWGARRETRLRDGVQQLQAAMRAAGEMPDAHELLEAKGADRRRG
jgi:hypothetical protein